MCGWGGERGSEEVGERVERVGGCGKRFERE